MPPRLRTLSGKDLVSVFVKLGFEVSSQRGSHIKLKRAVASGSQILVIPNHKSISKGTLQGIYKKALLYLPEEALKPYFYSE